VACGWAKDASLEERFRLARAMPLKNAAVGLPHGGGKAVIFGDPKQPVDRKERLVRAFASAIAPIADYIPGPDMGTDETCMAWIKDEIGRAVGLRPELGGIPLDKIGATGFGLAACAEAAQDAAGIRLRGARVVVRASARSASTPPAFSPKRERCLPPQPTPGAPSSTRTASMSRS
jgi:glutamate dehydrogenase (NAD(P)+)